MDNLALYTPLVVKILKKIKKCQNIFHSKNIDNFKNIEKIDSGYYRLFVI